MVVRVEKDSGDGGRGKQNYTGGSVSLVVVLVLQISQEQGQKVWYLVVEMVVVQVVVRNA